MSKRFLYGLLRVKVLFASRTEYLLWYKGLKHDYAMTLRRFVKPAFYRVRGGYNLRHRVTEGGPHLPPVPTERNVRISRTTLFNQ